MSFHVIKGLKHELTRPSLAPPHTHSHTIIIKYPFINLVIYRQLIENENAICYYPSNLPTHSTTILYPNVKFKYVRGADVKLHSDGGGAAAGTWSCASSPVAVDYIYRSSWMVSDLRHEHSLLSTWKSWPFCQPLSRSPAACIPKISPGSGLVLWPEEPNGREELSRGWERIQRVERGGEGMKKPWTGHRERKDSLRLCAEERGQSDHYLTEGQSVCSFQRHTSLEDSHSTVRLWSNTGYFWEHELIVNANAVVILSLSLFQSVLSCSPPLCSCF